MASSSDVARSTRTGARGSQSGGKKDKNKKKELHLTINKDGRDQLEDSGIGLDESLTPVFFGVTDSSSKPPPSKEQPHRHRGSATSSPSSAPSYYPSLELLSTSRQSKGHHTSDMSQQQKISTTVLTDIRQSGTRENLDRDMNRSASSGVTAKSPAGQGYSQVTKGSKTIVTMTSSSSSSSTSHSAHFIMGSDSEDDKEVRSTHSPARSSSQKSSTGSKSKSRFRRMLKGGLRRSHSAGCSQDVPAHALFLKHQTDIKQSSSTSHTAGNRSASTSDQGQVGSDSETEESEKRSKSKKKSLARDIKEKMAFLRRRHTDTALTGKVGDNKSHRVTPESVAKWSRSFDNLLYDKVGLEMFRDFLRSEFSDENLEFWIACEEYKNLKAAKIPEQAQKMYTDFVAVQAPREINLDSKTRMACKDKLGSPNKHTFEEAQKRIQALMEKDSYPRFLQSEPYLELCNDLKLNT